MIFDKVFNWFNLRDIRFLWIENIALLVSELSFDKFVVIIETYQLRLVFTTFNLRIDHFSIGTISIFLAVFPAVFNVVGPVSDIFDFRIEVDISSMAVFVTVSVFASVDVPIIIFDLYERIFKLISIKLSIDNSSIA